MARISTINKLLNKYWQILTHPSRSENQLIAFQPTFTCPISQVIRQAGRQVSKLNHITHAVGTSAAKAKCFQKQGQTPPPLHTHEVASNYNVY